MEKVKTRTKPCYHFRNYKCEDYTEINNCWHSTKTLGARVFSLYSTSSTLTTELNSKKLPVKFCIFSSFLVTKMLKDYILNPVCCELLKNGFKKILNCYKLWQIFVFSCFTMVIPLLVCPYRDSRPNILHTNQNNF